MKKTSETLEKYAVNLLYMKKAHFNAASRKLILKRTIFWVNLFLSTFAGSAILVYLQIQNGVLFAYLSMISALFTSMLSIAQYHMKLDEQIDGNNRTAGKCLEVQRRISMLLANLSDVTISGDAFLEKVQNLIVEIDAVYSFSEPYSTSKADYNRARAGVRCGEETHTNSDLKILD